MLFQRSSKHTSETTVIIYAHRRHCRRDSRMKGISPSGISIWIERANIHIRLPVEWNEPRKIYILSLNLPLEIPLQTLTHITACCWHEKRRDFVAGHLVYYSYFYWSSSFVLFVSFFDWISRLSSCKKGIS